ncbi:UxaA family hydrolase [Prauserella rugosa]|uniref:(2R)-sulfolactate sulfo-lyase subunit alpha n=1 Tax=Prauserella rugosa TaxID=43354 RepID=A0A660CBM5_9PSEU|nr:UxaA family hydrolase [Prauserella rugosa]KID29563.1 hypothetical protein HQ32_02976 [Prauserella sp. Am3]KMS90580.1 dehydratase [Streptomyces regensis]TWH18331.1 (2R)-sulfolactate sulfo-lyase subunit alpha [Prauserella rugosa]
MTSSRPDFLAHRTGDAVAVAVRDLVPGPVRGGYLDDGDAAEELSLHHDVPLGHKLALRDIGAGEDVIEYGVRTAVASADIARGDYVHTHNVRSARWHNSVA